MTRADVAVLAIDLGASNGRGMLARFDGERIELEELGRFANGPVASPGGLRWDLPALMGQVEALIGRAVEATGGRLASVGLDTWGVDYGLLDRRGELLGLPFSYRDGRTGGVVERALGRISVEELYERTGSQTMSFNTAFQLLSEEGGPRWDAAATVLLLPDLVAYLLTGEIATERTIASTTQLYDPRERAWSEPVLTALGLPRSWFTALIDPGTPRGSLLPDVSRRTGAASDLRLVAVAGHDTASAFAATTTAPASFVISLGTWSLAGVERAEPLITEAALAADLSNEAGVAGTTRLLRNAAGLWLLQECRASWGPDAPDWDTLAEMAAFAPPLSALIDPDEARFSAPGDMPARLAAACEEGGSPAPTDPGTVVRVVLESLALRYRERLGQMERVLGRELPTVHVVGGGARNRLLCQLTADATGRTVLAGPAEATALGNAGVQLMALGHIGGLGELRAVIDRSFPVETYEPAGDGAAWQAAEERFRRLPGREDLDVELGG